MIVTLAELAEDDELRDRLAFLAETQVHDPEAFEAFRVMHPDLCADVEEALRGLSIEVSSAEWREGAARPEQLIPGTPGSFSDRVDWTVWLLMGGRGSGKTRTGAEAVKEMVLGRVWTETPFVALVGQTLDDVRTTMVEQTLLPILPPGSVLKWNRSTVELYLSNGAYLKGYGSDSPRRLRGFNGHIAWCDELATFTDADRSPAAPDTTWTNMMMALREDDGGTWTPRIVATTTPKAVRLLQNDDPLDLSNPGPGIHDQPSTVVSNMSTFANVEHLAESFIANTVMPLKGTRIWDQEVLGKLLGASLGAFWTLEAAEAMVCADGPLEWRVRAGGLDQVVVAVDPSVGAGDGDECGIMVMGLARDGRVYMLEDLSLRAHPSKWSKVVSDAVTKWAGTAYSTPDIVGVRSKPDDRPGICVVAEYNNGHTLVTETLSAAGVNVDIFPVWASTKKRARIEPVAVLSDREMPDDPNRGMIRIADPTGAPKLRKQMTTYEGDGDSPDRLDAFVYGVAWLKPQEWGMQSIFSVGEMVGARP
jgi:phage terminase large subunit-like protein